MCAFMSALDWPEGCWQKGGTTTLLGVARLRFCKGREEWLESHVSQPELMDRIQGNKRWCLILLTVQKRSRFFRNLYHSRWWLNQETAKVIAEAGLTALRASHALAEESLITALPGSF